MADNVTFQSTTAATPPANTIVATETITQAPNPAAQAQVIKVALGGLDAYTGDLNGANADYDTGAGTQNVTMFGVALPAGGGAVPGGTVANPFNVTGSLTDAQLRATAVPVSGPLTDTQLRATAVPVSGALTDTQLRASPVPMTNQQSNTTADYDTGAGTQNVTMFGVALPASGGAVAGGTATNPLNVTGALTDTQLRATAVPVSGPLTDTQLRATAVPVSGPLTDTQLRASAIPVSMAAAPAGAATSAKQPALGTAGSPSTDVLTVQGITSGTPQPVSPAAALYSADTTLQNAAAATGNGTNADVSGATAVVVQVTGTFVATITWEASNDGGTTWVAIPLTNLVTGVASTTATAPGLYSANVAGLKLLRGRISAYTSGSVTATAHAITAGSAGQMLASLYGKVTNAGDTPVTLSSSTEAATTKNTQGMVQATLWVMNGAGTAAPLVPPSGSGDGASASTMLGEVPYLLNGAAYDRQRSNTDLSGLTSAARTATTATPDQVNYNGSVAIAVLNITAASGTGGLQPRFQGKDSISGTYYNLAAAPTTIIATGIYIYVLGKGGGTVAGDVQQAVTQPLPRTWRVNVVAGDASSYTYSLSIVNAL